MSDDLRQYEILQGDEQVGALACYPDKCESEVQALTGAGFMVREGFDVEFEVREEGAIAVEAEGELHRLDAECTPEEHEPCDISTAVAFLRDTAEEAGVATPDLQDLLDNGYRDKEEVIVVMEAVKARLHEGQAKMEAEQALALARGEIDIDAEAAE